MSRLKKLQDKVAELRNKLVAIEKKCVEENRDFTTEELDETARLTVEYRAVRADLDDQNRLQDFERSLPPVRDANQDTDREAADRNGGYAPWGSGRGHGFEASPRTYAGMFAGGRPLSNDGFSCWAEFLHAIGSDRRDDRLTPQASMGESIGSTGGFLVPEIMAARMLDSIIEESIVLPRCDLWPMLSETLPIPGFDASDSSASLFGGFVEHWFVEGEAATDSEPKYRAIKMRARKLGLFTKASNELAMDAPQFAARLADR